MFANPNHFIELTAVDNNNFEVYSQKGGNPRRCSLQNLNKYLSVKKKTINYDPNNGIPQADRNNILIYNNDVYFADINGFLVKLNSSNGGVQQGLGISITNGVVSFNASTLPQIQTVTGNDEVIVKTASQPNGARILLGALNFQGQFVGTHDASNGNLPTLGTGINGAIRKGDYYVISVGGTVTGLLPNPFLQAGNIIFALFDNATTAAQFSSVAAMAQTYTQGQGITITGAVIENTAPDQIVSLTQGQGITITGTYPNFTITGNGLTGLQDGNGTTYTQGQVDLGGSITSDVNFDMSATMTFEGAYPIKLVQDVQNSDTVSFEMNIFDSTVAVPAEVFRIEHLEGGFVSNWVKTSIRWLINGVERFKVNANNIYFAAYPNSRIDSTTATNFLYTDSNGILQSKPIASLSNSGYNITTTPVKTGNKFKGFDIWVVLLSANNCSPFVINGNIITLNFQESLSNGAAWTKIISAKGTSLGQNAIKAQVTGTSTGGGNSQTQMQITIDPTQGFNTGEELIVEFIR